MCVRNDAGELSLNDEDKMKAWVEHYSRLLNVEFEWPKDELPVAAPVVGPPPPVTTEMISSALSKMSEDSCLNLTFKTDWTRPDDLKTQEEYQVAADRCSSEDSCLNLTREDWTRPGDLKTSDYYNQWGLLSEPDRTDWTRPDELKTQEEYQVCPAEGQQS
ncbi:hypothetical protein Bbelb_191040 [Branchiostoma belcheri]|nr:hypothetical protein Bbelb_191040 [Branchiostoma belcheri]